MSNTTSMAADSTATATIENNSSHDKTKVGVNGNNHDADGGGVRKDDHAAAAPTERPETPAEKLLRVSRLYFLLGFAFLPWMWAVNALMLWQYRSSTRVPADVVWYRNWSAICFCISSVIFSLYVILSWTVLEDHVPWAIRPGLLPKRQNGIFTQATIA